MVDQVSVKRVYDPPGDEDGTRMLIDRLWPRGVRRAYWPGNAWRPDLAPSTELRRTFHGDDVDFERFATQYRDELDANPAIEGVLAIEGTLTLVTAARHPQRSHAAVLAAYLVERAGR